MNQRSKIKRIKESGSKKKKIREDLWQFNYKEKPIWLCKLEEITKEEYTSSYKSLTNVWNDYLIVKHFSIKGQLELKVVFFLPKRDPFDLFDTHNMKNIKLYNRGSSL